MNSLRKIWLLAAGIWQLAGEMIPLQLWLIAFNALLKRSTRLGKSPQAASCKRPVARSPNYSSIVFTE